MKKQMAFVLGLLLTVSNAFAQDEVKRTRARKRADQTQSYRFGLNAEPIWVLIGGVGARADLAFTRRIALSVHGIYIPERSNTTSEDDKNTTTIDNDYKWSYSEFNIGPTFMLTGDLSRHGLYLNTSVGYVKAQISEYSSLNLQGELAAAQVRATIGYQWRIGGLRLAAGGGLRAIQSDDIIVKDGQGQEVHREKSSALGGLALDAHVGWVF